MKFRNKLKLEFEKFRLVVNFIPQSYGHYLIKLPVVRNSPEHRIVFQNSNGTIFVFGFFLTLGWNIKERKKPVKY